MKRVLLISVSLLLALASPLAQNSTIRGLVKLKSSGETPLSDVRIAASGATQTFTNSSGQFELRFGSKRQGDQVTLVADKNGYEVINDRELITYIRSNPDDLVTIVMARQGQRAQEAAEYYQIGLKSITGKTEKEVQEIRKRLEAGAADKANVDEQILTILQENQKKLAMLEEAATELAGVDTDRSSELTRRALELSKEGDIDQALAILDDASLEGNLAAARKMQMQAREDLDKADNAVKQSVETYVVKARLEKLKGNADDAYANYLVAVEADSTNFAYILEFAEFIVQLQNYKEAAAYFEKALRLAVHVKETADATFALTEVYNALNEHSEAEKALLKIRDVIANASTRDVDQVWRDQALATTDYLLGLTYSKWEKPAEAEEYLSRALKAYDLLNLMMIDELDEVRQADVMHELGDLYLKEGPSLNPKAADSVFQKAVPLYQRFAQAYPERFEDKLAHIYYSVARANEWLYQFNMVDTFYKQAIDLYEKLNVSHFHYYDKDIAGARNGLALNLLRTGKYAEAEKMATTALDIYRELIRSKSRDAYMDEMAAVLKTKGDAGMFLGNYQAADRDLSGAVELYRKLSSSTENADKYKRQIGITYVSLSALYLYMSRFADAEQAARDGQAVFPIKMLNTNLVRALVYQGKFNEARDIYVEFADQKYPYNPLKTWRQVFLDDLQDLEDKGITHPDVAKARKLLEK